MPARRLALVAFAAAIFALVFATLVAETSRPAHAAQRHTIEAPSFAKKGLGLVLLVSLQRA